MRVGMHSSVGDVAFPAIKVKSMDAWMASGGSRMGVTHVARVKLGCEASSI